MSPFPLLFPPLPNPHVSLFLWPPLGIYPKNPETPIQENTLIYAPQDSLQRYFTIAKTWKLPKGPSVDEWFKKLRYIYTMEHYIAIERRTSYLL